MPTDEAQYDVDIVPPAPKQSKQTKKPPPKVWKTPQFDPMQMKNPLSYGKGQLPPYIDPTSLYDLFSLFFTD